MSRSAERARAQCSGKPTSASHPRNSIPCLGKEDILRFARVNIDYNISWQKISTTAGEVHVGIENIYNNARGKYIQ